MEIKQYTFLRHLSHTPKCFSFHPYSLTYIAIIRSGLVTRIHAMKSQASEPSRWPLALHLQKSKMLGSVTSTPCVRLHRVVFRYRGNFTAVYLIKVL
jgi:hypothetical protein